MLENLNYLHGPIKKIYALYLAALFVTIISLVVLKPFWLFSELLLAILFIFDIYFIKIKSKLSYKVVLLDTCIFLLWGFLLYSTS